MAEARHERDLIEELEKKRGNLSNPNRDPEGQNNQRATSIAVYDVGIAVVKMLGNINRFIRGVN